MTIYVRSITSNRAVSVVDFNNKEDLARYASERADIWVKSRMTIEDILDALYDTHISTVTGSVWHCRILRKDAIQAIRNGAKNHTWLNVKRKEA